MHRVLVAIDMTSQCHVTCILLPKIHIPQKGNKQVLLLWQQSITKVKETIQLRCVEAGAIVFPFISVLLINAELAAAYSIGHICAYCRPEWKHIC